MQKIIVIISYVFIIFIFSCEEDMDVNLNTGANKRLVVDGFITNLSLKNDTFSLSYTTDYFSDEPTPYVSNANVIISDNENVVYQLMNIGDGKYIIDKNDYIGKIGNTYELNITVDGESYTSSMKMASVATIDSITWRYIYNGENDTYEYQMLYFGQDPPEEGNYYMWVPYFNNKLVNDTLKETLFTDDNAVNGNYVNNWPIVSLDSAELDFETKYINEMGDHVYPDTINVKFEMYSIPKSYYEFLIAAMLETEWKGGPFDGPPANVPSNISNNAVGFFYAAAVSVYEFTLIRSER